MQESRPKTIALIVAAGRGSRAGPGGPKQYRSLAGKTVLERTATAFLNHPAIDLVKIVVHREDHPAYADAMGALADHPKLSPPVNGGAERQASVRLGLESIAYDEPELVLIHDAARPFIDAQTIDRVVDALAAFDGAIAALPVFDTIKRSNGADAPCIDETVPREALWRAQTPQGFKYKEILKAHQEVSDQVLTDDAAVAEAAGLSVRLVSGAPDNMKITQAEDFGMAQTLLERQEAEGQDAKRQAGMREYRTGHGYDVHAFESGDHVIICGVRIPHDGALKGHSDADVGMHAVTDAILGALGEGDIGDHFPPSDPQWRGAASEIFLQKARDLVRSHDGVLTHCDITLVCEAPKIGPHRQDMRNALAAILAIDPKRVSVKATTSEKLGFTGRREGIAALATATVALPVTE
ncbi:MAG: bifunctional 2-C-methyl-D-erythritol 4-phosphate cytidylyltransferase/2-C-methyl-D-erythritol 2,4-cyclodiphosphate synthase [Pseudomonadota bacterium]